LVTIKDVAKAAGVTTGTVSKVLNGYTTLTAETIEKVKRTIVELNYQPNMMAQSMRTKKSKTIGIVVPDMRHPFFIELYVELQHILSKRGYACFATSSQTSEEKEIKSLKSLLVRQVDGIIFSSVGWDEKTTSEILEISEKIPLVSLNRIFSKTTIRSVNVDYFAGVVKAMKHLKDLGHTRIAFISGHIGSPAGDDRMRAYLSFYNQNRLERREEWVAAGNMDVKSGYFAMKEIMKAPVLPTAIVAGNDAMAIGASWYLRERKIKIPEDVAMVGFDDVEWAMISDPPLTTLRVPRDTIAQNVAEMLAGENETQNVLIEPELIVRHSTDPTVEVSFNW